MLPYFTAGASLVAVILLWNLYTRFASDGLQKLNDNRRAASRLVGRAEFVDGNRHIGVAIAVTDTTFFYENADLEGSLDLENIEAIEYDNELITGSMVSNGKVLRLRCHSQNFEFVLNPDDVARWSAVMPGGSPREAAVAQIAVA